MSVTVLVPWQSGCPHREAAWEWVRERYETTGWSIALSEQHGGEWSKAKAVMAAVPLCDEIVVIADADCWTVGVAQAVCAVEDGAKWAVPHRKVHRLTRGSTAKVLAGADPDGLRTIERPYQGIKGGGVVAVRRDVLRDIPFDRRFVGWGKTDRAWRDAMVTLAGEPWRGEAPLHHLWHPPQPRQGRITASPANEALYARYRAARGKPESMRRLIAECTP